MRQLLFTITLVLAVMFSALAQTTAAPDFSGTWVLNAAKSFAQLNRYIGGEIVISPNRDA